MKIMVTGSMGYIGSILCQYLVADGGDVVQIDRRINKDINHMNAYDNTDCGFIIHLAALPGIQACEDHKNRAFRDNVLATVNISNFARENDIPILFASSQASKTPKESTYAMHKHICEGIVLTRNDCAVMNFSNIYGGRGYLEKKGSIMSVFTKQLYNCHALTVDGDGTQVRDFIYIEDVISGIVSCMENFEKLNGVTVDIGTGVGTSINQLANMFAENRENSTVTYNNDRGIGVQGNVADISTMIELTDWQPQVSIEDGVKKMIKDGY
jgi:UDP-glucose 4-epimerase